MAIRQYIGARYVPRFIGTYDATQIYDALDVVDNGSGTSYIARKTVPAGTPLTDTDHWFVYGASSGAIIALQNDMIQAQNDILGLQGDVDNLETKLSIKRRVVCISDSYGLVRGGNTPWVNYLQTYLDVDNADFFAYSEGSMGFNRTGDNGHVAETLLQAHASDITDHDTISDVIFGLGINDIYGTIGTLDSAIDSCISYVKTEYPNAKIYIAYIGNLAVKNSSTFDLYAETIVRYGNACGRNAIISIEGCENVMHNNNFFQSDGIHPTSAGCSAIAGYIASFLVGGASYTRYKRCSVVSSNFGAASEIRQTISNGVASVALSLDNVATALTLTRNVAVNIGSITDPLIRGIGGSIHYTPVVVYDGTDYHLALWYIFNGDVYIMAKQGGASITLPVGSVATAMAASYPTIES